MRVCSRLAISACTTFALLCGCSHEWPDYRYDNFRSGVQPFASDLSDPRKVHTLAVRWSFPAEGRDTGKFLSSPIIVNDTVFIGSTSGHFYALDVHTGALKWQYPVPPKPPLVPSVSTFAYGIQSSASFWGRDSDGAVVFGAQDPSLGQYGSARLFALNAATGALIWASDPVAITNGDTAGDVNQLHEKIGFSSPLIFDNKAYVGISDHADNPLQDGKVVAIDITTGKIVSTFHYVSTATRGGGVWNAPASDFTDIYFSTGNTRCDDVGCQIPEPSPNHGLSMIRANKDTGSIVWAFQPVPYALDDDPDWSAGAAVDLASCGEFVTSVQKDGWTYAINAGNGKPGAPVVLWQFPPTGYPFTAYTHSNDGYNRNGAAWNDVLVITTGGESRAADGPSAGYGVLQALNVCPTMESDRVRWILDVPDSSHGSSSLGAPTVAGGIVYVGTDEGHLVAMADPSVAAAAGGVCSNPDFTTGSDCATAGYVVVPVPSVLADVTMPDKSGIAGLRDEPALANGRIVVGTDGGHVYMLSP
jgi:outer membrane protein assembly factor BamB